VLTQAFKNVGYNAPTVVSGSAVEFWTRGRIGTKDIEMTLLTQHEKVDFVMTALGFESQGRHWVHRLHEFLVKYPSDAFKPGFTFDEIEALGTKVRIISREAAILNRIDSHQTTGYELDGLRALLLFAAADETDWLRVEAATLGSGLPLATVKRYKMLAPQIRSGSIADKVVVKSALSRLSRP
jgi:hypothetical protein